MIDIHHFLANFILRDSRREQLHCNDLPHLTLDKNHAPAVQNMDHRHSAVWQQSHHLISYQILRGCSTQPIHICTTLWDRPRTLMHATRPQHEAQKGGAGVILTEFAWSGSTVITAWSLNCSLILLSNLGSFPPKKEIRKEGNHINTANWPFCALLSQPFSCTYIICYVLTICLKHKAHTRLQSLPTLKHHNH